MLITTNETELETLTAIEESTALSASLLEKFSDVFDTINSTLFNQSLMMREMLRLNSEQFEITQRKEALASVSGAPTIPVQQPITTVPVTATNSKMFDADDIGPSFMQGLMTNWLANMFSGGKNFSQSLFAGGLGSLVKKGAIIGIVAPWLQDFISEATTEALKNVGLDEETKKMLASRGSEAARNALIGGALFGTKGAIIGGLAPFISAAGMELAKQYGIALDKEVMNFGGFSVTGNDAANIGGLAAAAGLTVAGPAAAKGAIAVAMANPVAAAIAVGATAAAIGTKMARDRRADFTGIDDKDFTGDFTVDTNDFRRAQAGLGYNFDAQNDGDRLAKLSSQVDELTNGGQDTTNLAPQILDNLTLALKKAGIDLNNPNIGPETMSTQNVNTIIDILEQLKQNELAKKWKEQRTKNIEPYSLFNTNKNYKNTAEEQKLYILRERYNRTGDPQDLKKVQEQEQKLGIINQQQDLSISPQSFIEPNIKNRQANIAIVKSDGVATSARVSGGVNIIKGGDAYVTTSNNPVSVQAPISQAITNYSYPSFSMPSNPRGISD